MGFLCTVNDLFVILQKYLDYRSYVTVKRFEKLSLKFSVSLFVIRVNLLHLLHPCSFMVYYYLFGVFLSLFVEYYFQVSFNFKVILSMVKRTQNTVIVT